MAGLPPAAGLWANLGRWRCTCCSVVAACRWAGVDHGVPVSGDGVPAELASFASHLDQVRDAASTSGDAHAPSDG